MGGSPDSDYLHRARVNARAAREATLAATLHTIAAGVTDVVGYQAVAISRLDDDGCLEVAAVSGSEEARAAIMGRRTPMAVMDRVLAAGEHWHDLCFIPSSSYDDAVPGWVPDYIPVDEPDAWLPEDALTAMLVDEKGRRVGMLSVDLPLDGKRPTPRTLGLLEGYASEASAVITEALARDQLAEQVWLGTATRQIMRIASAELRIEKIVDACQPVITEAFDARGLWIQAFDESGIGHGAVHTPGGRRLEMPAHLVGIAVAAAHAAWAAHEVRVISETEPRASDVDGLRARELAEIRAFLAQIGVASMLFIPLGAGPEVLGNLVLTRTGSARPWTVAERVAARDVGHDLGRILLNARLFEKERHLVDELTRLDDYKSRLISTISHELKSPLTSIVGHLELIETATVEPGIRDSLDRITRGAQRMNRIIEDLLALSRVTNPGQAHAAAAVDLAQLVAGVVDLLGVQAEQKHITLDVEAPDELLLAYGDQEELHRLCVNLVSNAIKYSPAGGPVTVRLSAHRPQVELEVIDAGIGISEVDQKQLFDEFFRSADPAAASAPGTGLGLAIVRQIVEHHGGTIDVQSELGWGSTFRVRLPMAPAEAP